MVVKTPRQGVLSSYADLLQDLARWKSLSFHPNILQLLYVELINDIPRIFLEWVPSYTLEGNTKHFDYGRKENKLLKIAFY